MTQQIHARVAEVLDEVYSGVSHDRLNALKAQLLQSIGEAMLTHQEALFRYSAASMGETRPNRALFGTTEMFRVNSVAGKILDIFDIARREARDEALWLAAATRDAMRDNDRLRVENERLRSAIEKRAVKEHDAETLPAIEGQTKETPK